jgi:signal transduction histidine kinase/CheY-like chemotaxis protein
MKQTAQHIITDSKGKIKESNQVLFFLPIETSLCEFHPIFFNLEELCSCRDLIVFNGVSLSLPGKSILVDIEISVKGQTVSIVVQDLTQFYETYQHVAQEKNELNLHLEKSNEINFVLEKQKRSKDIFIQDFSHELRNPLMHLVSFISLLSTTQLTNEQQEYVSYIQQSGQRLEKILAEILDLEHISSGKLRVQKERFSFANLIETIRLVYTIKADKQNLNFDVICNKTIPEVLEGDEKILYQVLTNLLDNAFKLTSQGEIKLKISVNKKWGNRINLNFQVSDSRPGSAKQDFAVILDGTAEVVSTMHTGMSNLGLTIVKKLLLALKSEVKTTKNPHGGNVFYFDVGFRTIPYSIKDRPNSKKRKIKDAETKRNRKRIIVVENDPQTQGILFKFLLDEKRFSIDAYSGTENLIQILTDNKYEIIIMSINLPNTKGHEIAQIIRDIPSKKISTTPIIGLTATAYKKDIDVFKAHGMNMVLTKPFSKEELLLAIDTLI